MPKSPEIGTLFRISLEDGRHTYARIVSSTRVAVYDAPTAEFLSLEKLLERPILFIVSCAIQFADEEWNRVKSHRFKNSEFDLPMMFSQNRQDPTEIYI